MSSLFGWLWSGVVDLLKSIGLYNKTGKLLFLGLDNAGKTTLLHLLKTGTLTVPEPTGNPQFEEISIGGVTIAAHDLGGHKAARRIWNNYFPEVNGVVFIVDASDQFRFPEVKQVLAELLTTKQLEKAPFLILANKIDKPTAVSSEDQFKKALGLDSGDMLTTCTGKTNYKLGKDVRPLEVFMCSVAKKAGYADGFKWLTNFF